MSVFTFHLTKTNITTALKAFWNPPTANTVPGLIHAECMTSMKLGSPIFSTERMLMRQVAVFAQWEDEAAIDSFLESNSLGQALAKGWHTRLTFLRQWGHIDEFELPDASEALNDSDAPVVAVTLARMKLFQVPRFIRWGRPVEKQVRDDPGTTLAMAAIRLPNTVSTFSVWNTLKEMENMAHGHSATPKPKRHAKAMKERERKDFHYQFTTLRFKPIAEYGEWQGRTSFIPNLNKTSAK